MDDIVLRGMAKWPNVPAVYGWLALNCRGQWLIKGDPVTNPSVSAFIGRNYASDAEGRWFFQNGPQRVFVSLDYTPFVYRATRSGETSFALEAHTGSRAGAASGAWLDEHGVLLVQTDVGVGVIHDSDLEITSLGFVDENGERLDEDALEASIERLQRGESAALWLKHGEHTVRLEPIDSAEVPHRFGFVATPGAPDGHPECS